MQDTVMQDAPGDGQSDQPRKRAAVGDGVSAGSGSPRRESESPPRSRAHQVIEPHLSRPPAQNRQLWTPEMDSRPTRSFTSPSNIASKSRAPAPIPKARKPTNMPRPASMPGPGPVTNKPGTLQILGSKPVTVLSPASPKGYELMLQPETRSISQEQLVAEVKGIYAGLVMVEAKCIEVDNKQAALAQADPKTQTAQTKLNNEQWQALIALHRTLLHEHHDFFLASQHPSASPALRRLASKYAMPARMWRHGIHSFLELLRHRLPASLDHMLAFIYLAYSMMALLYETVPAFEDTWIECLGDLGRYRMAIEDDDVRDREVWTGVARHWYSKASDKAPTTGRLYHHLAILARPNALQQLFYYSKSLCVVVPFTSARESILTLFDPVLNSDNVQGYRLPPLDRAFVKAHGILFTNRNLERFRSIVKEFLDLLDSHIGRVTRKFLEQGYYIAISNIVSMLGFASEENILMKSIADRSTGESDIEMAELTDRDPMMKSFLDAESFTNGTLEIILRRIGDPNVLSFIHVTLVFMNFMSRHPRAVRYLETNFPWQLLTDMLNTLLATYPTLHRIEDTKFPLPVKDDVRPLPEDFALRGLLWADGYYPESWFSNEKIDDEEKYLEVASMTDERKERILWLACRLASAGSWIYYDGQTRRFSTSPIEPPLDSRE